MLFLPQSWFVNTMDFPCYSVIDSDNDTTLYNNQGPHDTSKNTVDSSIILLNHVNLLTDWADQSLE